MQVRLPHILITLGALFVAPVHVSLADSTEACTVKTLEQENRATWSRYFHGPEPERFRAEHRYTRGAIARLQNPSSYSADEVYSSEQYVMRLMAEQGRDQLRASLRESNLTGSCLSGACGVSSEDAATRLRSFFDANGIQASLHTHLAPEIFGSTSAAHGFTVVRFSSGRVYLFDATFRQFLNPDAIGRGRRAGNVGNFLRNSPGGNELADILVHYGFIELTPEAANLYGRALSAEAWTPLDHSQYLKLSRQNFPIESYLQDSTNLGNEFSDHAEWRQHQQINRTNRRQPPSL